jgi:protein phosphatase PTC7
MFGGAFFEDLPRDAAISKVCMQHGDVLVLATDGVFDNLNNQDILKIVSGRMTFAGAWTGTAAVEIGVSRQLDALTRPGGVDSALLSPLPPPNQILSRMADSQASSLDNATSGHGQTLQALLAASIVGEAKLASIDFRRDGPFAKEVQRYFPWEWYRGGKVDDICVVVVIAVAVEQES